MRPLLVNGLLHTRFSVRPLRIPRPLLCQQGRARVDLRQSETGYMIESAFNFLSGKKADYMMVDDIVHSEMWCG